MTCKVALLGIGSDHHSSFLKGAAEAPALIRESMFCPSSNSASETVVDVLSADLLTDMGDMVFSEREQPIAQIEHEITKLAKSGNIPLALGGDHAITYPIIKALSGQYSSLTILHFDAHPDLYDEFEGDRYSHACPFARIMELGCVNRLLQFGIRTANAHQKAQIAKFGVETHDMMFLQEHEINLNIRGPVYISIDMDCLDPAYAPGVSHREPGGMSVREVLNVIHQLRHQECQIIGADVVEYNPSRDIDNMTSVVAAKFVKELLGLIEITNEKR